MLKQDFRSFRRLAFSTCLQVLLLLTTVIVSAQAADLPEPVGPALLEIVGKLEHSNATLQINGKSESAAVFDLALLESLPAVTIRTQTPWTKGVGEFTGVRMDVLLERVGASSEHLVLEALDEYSVESLEEPYQSYPIVIAYKLNGKYMSVRELGPLWVMYPFDAYPELNSEQSRAQCVWQLRRITVR